MRTGTGGDNLNLAVVGVGPDIGVTLAGMVLMQGTKRWTEWRGQLEETRGAVGAPV